MPAPRCSRCGATDIGTTTTMVSAAHTLLIFCQNCGAIMSALPVPYLHTADSIRAMIRGELAKATPQPPHPASQRD